jgi:hypothetical protein
MAAPRRTYVVSLYEGEATVVVEAVGREERERLASLDELPARIRCWEAADSIHDQGDDPA